MHSASIKVRVRVTVIVTVRVRGRVRVRVKVRVGDSTKDDKQYFVEVRLMVALGFRVQG